jgi:hypothetical protein
MMVAGATVVVVVFGALVVVVGGGVVVVGGGVVVVVLRIGVNTREAPAVDVARDGIGVRDDVLPRRSGGEVVMVVPTTFVVVVVLLAVAAGTVGAPFTCWKESVGGGGVLVSEKPHTAPLTASTATTSATPGYQTPSRT